MKKDGLQRMLDFFDFLRAKNIEFRLEQQQPDGVMASFTMVGFRVEVEFFTDELQYSVFRGDEDVSTDEKALYDLVNQYGS